MSDIAPLHNANAAASYSPVGRINPSTSTPLDLSRGSDQIELSDTARILSKLANLPDIREDLVNRVRAQIADGTYDVDGKLDLAIDGLAEDLLNG